MKNPTELEMTAIGLHAGLESLSEHTRRGEVVGDVELCPRLLKEALQAPQIFWDLSQAFCPSTDQTEKFMGFKFGEYGGHTWKLIMLEKLALHHC